jgi:SAM-dependent methyltransferase
MLKKYSDQRFIGASLRSATGGAPQNDRAFASLSIATQSAEYITSESPSYGSQAPETSPRARITACCHMTQRSSSEAVRKPGSPVYCLATLNLDKWTSGSAYDQWMGRWSRLLADEFLKWLCVSSGARWLDVCCGSGVVTEAIAEFCSPGSIVGIDASPAQIAFARMHRTRSGITFELSDATAVPFPDANFDAAVCGLGLNYISEPARALQEMQRVTRSGGTIAAYIWDYAQGVRFLREFWDAAIAVDPEARDFDQGRRFPMCSPDGLRTLFQVIEVKEVKLSALQIVTRFASFDES